MKTIINLILVVIVVLFAVNNICFAEVVQGDEIKVEMVPNANSVSFVQNDSSSSVTSFKEFGDNVQPNQELVEVLKDINSTLKDINANIMAIGFIFLIFFIFKKYSK